MREIFSMLKRNILLYVRDHVAVFFSVLSMLIVLALMAIFLGNMNAENIVDALAGFGGVRDTAADEKNAACLVQMWTLAGILEVNAVTVPMSVMGNMVDDAVRNRLASFWLAPVRRIKIILAYIFSSWIVGSVMCVLTLICGQIFLAVKGNPVLTAADCGNLLWMILLNTMVYASLAYLIATLVHSMSAWSSLLTIVGTLVGFVGAVYLPMSMLPESVANVIKCLPVLHGTAMMREVCTKDAIAETFAGLPEIAGDQYRKAMGISVYWGDNQFTLQFQVLFLIICAIIATAIAAVISRRRNLRDR